MEIAGALNRMAPDLFRPIRGDLMTALRDPDAGVRRAVLRPLAAVTRGRELLAAVRPLLSDPDTSVLYGLTGLLMDRTSSDLAEYLSPSDAEVIVRHCLESGDRDLQLRAARLLVALQGHLREKFIIGAAMRLIDDESTPERFSRTQSLMGKRFDDALADALSSLDLDGKVFLPDLLTLQRRRPNSPLLIKMLAATAGGEPQIASLLEKQLLSDDHAVRAAALAALSVKQFASPRVSDRYLSALIDEYAYEYVGARLDAVLRQIGRARTVVFHITGPQLRVWRFPWPPPPWSFKEVLPRSLLLGADADLGQVSKRLTAALRTASSDYDFGLFEAPGGFVLVARLERIHPDGTPFPGRDRWNEQHIPPQSLEEYLVDLFFSPPGIFRVVVFVVTGEEPTDNNPRAELPSLRTGRKTLLDQTARLPFSGRQVYALIYAFHRYEGAKMQLDYEPSPSGLTHLIASGIWNALKSLSHAT